MDGSLSEEQRTLLRRAQAVLTAALDAVVVIDGDGVVVEWNEAAVRMFGHSRGAALGRLLGELIVPPEQRRAHREGIERYLRTGEGPVLGHRVEAEAVRVDGSRFLVELAITPSVVDGDVLFTGYLRDISAVRAMQDRLQQSEERLAALIAHVADIVTIVAADGTWRYSSPAGTRLLGYEPGFDPEGGLFSLLHPDDVEVARRALEEVVEGKRSPSEPVELRVIGADGRYRTLETVGDDLTRVPSIGGVVLTSHDVTDRKEAERRLERVAAYLGAMVQNLADGVLLVEGESFRIAAVNAAFVDLFGYDHAPSDLVGRDVSSIRSSVREIVADPDGFAARVNDLYRTRERSTEIVAFADGRQLERDYIPVPLNGSRHAHLWLYRDVTEREQTEQLRRRMLDQERAARSAAESSNASLRELARLKTELLASVSHELRTPLTSLRTFVELLEADAAQLSSEHREFLDAIERNTDRLFTLVEDLLLLAELESRSLPFEPGPHQLATLIDDAVAAVGPLARSRSIAISTDIAAGPPALVDTRRFGQLMANLLSNALKYTPPHGRVSVTAARATGRWAVVVADTGIGIPADDAERVGTRFFRAANTAGIPGTGLGLSISIAIAEMHGGTLTVRPGGEGGTAVTVTLPIARAQDRGRA